MHRPKILASSKNRGAQRLRFDLLLLPSSFDHYLLVPCGTIDCHIFSNLYPHSYALLCCIFDSIVEAECKNMLRDNKDLIHGRNCTTKRYLIKY